MKLALGIETSCDETAAAVVDEQGRVLSDVIHSQIATHLPYGGVIPELASRDHVVFAVPIVREALARASRTLEEIDLIAVTNRSGLAGALLVGVQLAKGLAWGSGTPLYGVDHLVGHIASPFLSRGEREIEPPPLPFVALLVSGGHTALYRVTGFLPSNIEELGATRDDAAGEAFDKGAKLLGLGYPGGPAIQRAAVGGNPRAVPFSSPMHGGSTLDFSFSGLKTQLRMWIDKHGVPAEAPALADVCASFQACIVDVLVKKTMDAVKLANATTVAIGGGVAANSALRETLVARARAENVRCLIPELASTTDNAAMIAFAALLQSGGREPDGLGLTVETKTSIPRVTRKGRGAR